MTTGYQGNALQTAKGGIPNSVYTVTAYYYIASPSTTATPTVGASNGTGTGSGWQPITVTGNTDASGNLVIVVSASATSGTPSVYFDDVTMAPVTAPNPVVTWGQTFGYDGFGNLLSETPTAGSAPHLNINVDTATNRVVATGVQYDAAGNMTNDGTQAYTYDEANRLKTVGNYFYTYSGLENKRVIAYNGNGSTPSATINLYGPDGKRLGYYRFSSTNGWTTTTALGFQNFLYLGNKALTYVEDRIGSAGNYFPYGNGYNVTGAEVPAFGTYVQDESGLMYADQRFYNPGFGRFMTADRSNANIDYGNPVSWNRYVYTNRDPVNGMDPTGQDDAVDVGGFFGFSSEDEGGDMGGGDGGNSLLGADQSGGDQSGTDQGGAGSGNSDPSVIDPAVIDPEGQIDLSGQNRGVQNLDPTTTTDVIFQSVWRGIGTTIDLIGVPLLILLNPSSTSMSDVLPSDCPPDTREPTPDNPQGVIFRPLRGSYCQVNAGTGEIWCLDRFHRDHYEVYKNLEQYENGQRDRSVWKNGCRRS